VGTRRSCFGVPSQNFLGWFAWAFAIFALYRVLERRWSQRG
jgi:uncharacterized membrane protein